MKDDTYSLFKRELSRYHRKGYKCNFPSTEENYDEDTQEHSYYIQVALFKKVKKRPEGI